MRKEEKKAIVNQVKQCIDAGNEKDQCLVAVGNTFDLEEDERDTIEKLLEGKDGV